MLTGTGAFFSGRWMACGKSPLTGTWGDANCGGYLAPALKKTGYDGIFFVGKSDKPVYLLIDGDRQELLDASELWGKLDTNETEDKLKEIHGQGFQVASIGPGGEKLSLIAGIVNDKGRIAARSGLGALMGSKNLKALCLRGTKAIDLYDAGAQSHHTAKFMDAFFDYKHKCEDKIMSSLTYKPAFSGIIRCLNSHNKLPQTEEMERYVMTTWGTAGITAFSANIGDSPVKNWKGAGCVDFPTSKAQYISNNYVTQYDVSRYGCHHCPLCCGAIVSVPDGPYPIKEAHKPEYETLCGFGTMLLADNVHAIIKVNDMLNRAGIDTISCAVVVAWAFEAYENGVLTTEQTDGLELTWGNAEAVVSLVEKIIYADGIGSYLKDGVKKAAEHFGPQSLEYAMNAGGQELPMHDTRNQQGGLGLGVAYEAEPTPGRHTSSLDACGYYRQESRALQSKRKHLHTMKMKVEESEGDSLRDSSCFMDLVNGLGLCAFAWGNGVVPPIVEWTNSATGWEKTFDDYLLIARRIKTVRQSFNIREGIKPADTVMTKRAAGIPPLKKGPNKDNTPDFEGARKKYYRAMGYDPETAKPLPETLDMLELPEVKKQLYGK